MIRLSLSQVYKVLCPLGEKVDFVIPSGFETKSNFDHKTSKFKPQSTRASERYMNDKIQFMVEKQHRFLDLVQRILNQILVSKDSFKLLLCIYSNPNKYLFSFLSQIADCTVALYLSCPDDVMLERLRKRAETSGRVDDNEETIKKRLKTFEDQTTPAINHYRERGLLKEVG